MVPYHALLQVREDTLIIYLKESWRSHVSSSGDSKSLQKIKRLLENDLKGKDHAKAPLHPSRSIL